MDDSILAKFLLYYGVDVEEWFTLKFENEEWCESYIYDAFDKFQDNNHDLVKDAVEEDTGLICELDDSEDFWYHPETLEEVYYETWDDLWENDIDDVFLIIKGTLYDVVAEEIGNGYLELMPLFEEEIEEYLQENLDSEWKNYN